MKRVKLLAGVVVLSAILVGCGVPLESNNNTVIRPSSEVVASKVYGTSFAVSKTIMEDGVNCYVVTNDHDYRMGLSCVKMK